MKREKPLLIKLTDDEKAAFKKVADLNGITLSAWARQKLRIAATKELQEAGQMVDFLPDQDKK